jgi:hypothetical protein
MRFWSGGTTGEAHTWGFALSVSGTTNLAPIYRDAELVARPRGEFNQRASAYGLVTKCCEKVNDLRRDAGVRQKPRRLRANRMYFVLG